jgi:hypothetical protein
LDGKYIKYSKIIIQCKDFIELAVVCLLRCTISFNIIPKIEQQ